MLAPKEPSCIDELIKKPDLSKTGGQKKAVKLGYDYVWLMYESFIEHI